ncbi:hypothetical protein BUY89_13435 [Staphylococcus equorum]|uniref:hypothetical protein n=1 Tax=Staphylococcus equorum TaxID=246432 RepID=UPI000D1C4C13|nr:hypothetical protein [Staphylococcus equorum]PTE90063.1 hypothetical protein BUY89_13435 [Staphylococcus equorum]
MGKLFLAKSLTEKDKCDGKISKAYAIQNNKILNKFAKNGHLITTGGNSNIIFQDIGEKCIILKIIKVIT